MSHEVTVYRKNTVEHVIRTFRDSLLVRVENCPGIIYISGALRFVFRAKTIIRLLRLRTAYCSINTFLVGIEQCNEYDFRVLLDRSQS